MRSFDLTTWQLLCLSVERHWSALGWPFLSFFFSLANVKSCVTVGPISLVVNVWSCIVPVDQLSGLAL